MGRWSRPKTDTVGQGDIVLFFTTGLVLSGPSFVYIGL